MVELVADVGNTRIKWGLCSAEGLSRTGAVPLDNPEAWNAKQIEWDVAEQGAWTLAGTHPDVRDRLADWLRQRGNAVRILDDYRQLPIRVLVDFPAKVGIDRLLNGVAVLNRVPRGIPAIIINAGTAVTVDLVDGEGVFRGGTIFPGYRLMAAALRDYTAKLPLIESFTDLAPPLPGTNTEAAITAGISYVIAGGIDRIVRKLTEAFGEPRVILAGGDSKLLLNLECWPDNAGPYLTLEGIRIASKNAPSA
jgi:type III pantothenate kinase